MRLGVCNLRRTGRYTAPTPLFNSVWWIARPRTVSALKTPHTSPPCHPFVGVSSVIFPILFFSLPLYGGATHQLAELPDVCFRSKADIRTQSCNVCFVPKTDSCIAANSGWRLDFGGPSTSPLVGERSVAAQMRRGVWFLLPVNEKIVRSNAAHYHWQAWKVACRSPHSGRCLASRPRA